MKISKEFLEMLLTMHRFNYRMSCEDVKYTEKYGVLLVTI